MKNIKLILVSILALSFLSCSNTNEEDFSERLKMDIGQSSGILIPAPATTLGCDQIAKGQTASAGTVSGTYFTLPNPKISWTPSAEELEASKGGTKPIEVRILVLKLTIRSPKVGGEYTCLFSDIALGSLFYRTSGVGDNVIVNTWDAKLGTKSGAKQFATQDLITAGLATGCDIKCGGLSIPKNAGVFTATGEWQLSAVRKQYASYRDDETSYTETPVQITGTFSVENVLK